MAISPNLGELGEQLTAQWLITQGWEILASRWRCRWGELDLVASNSSSLQKTDNQLIFVEVKTRQSNNWDADGLLAITPKKQEKLYRTAEIFLSSYPQFSSAGCRFDLALVKGRAFPSTQKQDKLSSLVALNHPIYYQGYELTLVTYLKGILE